MIKIIVVFALYFICATFAMNGIEKMEHYYGISNRDSILNCNMTMFNTLYIFWFITFIVAWWRCKVYSE